MGAEHSHPLKGSNPDPTWIPAWKQLSSDEAAEVAIAQAAVNRTWAIAVNAQFDVWWLDFGPLAERQRDRIAEIAANKGSHYAKIEALRALWEATAKAPGAERPYARYLLQFQIVDAAATIYADANADFATYPFIVALGADTGLATHGRALGTEAEERTQFVFAAMNGELWPTLPALPKMDAEGNGASVVKWPLDAAAEKQITARRKAAAEVGTALMTKPEDVPSFDTSAAPGLVVYLNAEGEDNIANGVTSKRVTAVGKNTVTLVGKRNATIPYNCHDRVVRDSGGDVQVQQDCKYKDDNTKLTITLEVDELPLELRVGDEVSVRGTVKEYKSTKGAINARLGDVFVESVQRGGERVF
jgi:hypothetical protein